MIDLLISNTILPHC